MMELYTQLLFVITHILYTRLCYTPWVLMNLSVLVNRQTELGSHYPKLELQGELL